MTSLFLISSLFLLMIPHPPLKMALVLTITSSICALLSYQITSSVFLSSSVIISFSSGMMILFCYCSMMSNYEGKNSSKGMLPFIFMVPLVMMISSSPNSNSPSIQKVTSMVSFSPLILFIMSLVIIAMKGMNLSFFNPTKKLLKSY